MAKGWTFSLGDYGNTVRVFEHANDSIYIAYSTGERRVRKSLGRITEAEARQRAYAVHEALLQQSDAVTEIGEYTLGRLLSAYRREMTRHKEHSVRRTENRIINLFTTLFGANTSPSEIKENEARRFLRLRTSGEIDAYGKHVPAKDRRCVSAGTASADLKTLRRMLAWGFRNEYVSRNGLDGLSVPMNPNPRRPVMSPERFAALRAVSDQVRTRYKRNGTRKWQYAPAYVSVLLDLAWHTGRRIDSILHLREGDFFPDRGPHGALLWRGDTDKMKRESLVPLNAEARAAIDRQLALKRPNGFMFPAPLQETKPVGTTTARDWLRGAEELASLDHIPGGGWHMFRRGFVTMRKGLSEPDLAALGGWKNPNVMRTHYQQPDFDAMSRVVQNPIPDEE